MTHPLPLTDTPIFGSLMTDPQFSELAKELFERQPLSAQFFRARKGLYHPSYDSLSLDGFNHPENCPACSTHRLSYLMHNPTPPLNRGLVLPPGSTTPTQSAKKPDRVARSRRTAQKVSS